MVLSVVLIILFGDITYRIYFLLISIVVNPEITSILLILVVVICDECLYNILIVISCVILVIHPNWNLTWIYLEPFKFLNFQCKYYSNILDESEVVECKGKCQLFSKNLLNEGWWHEDFLTVEEIV